MKFPSAVFFLMGWFACSVYGQTGSVVIGPDPDTDQEVTETEEIPHLLQLSKVPRIGAVGDSLTDEYSTYPYGLLSRNWVQFHEIIGKGEFGNFRTLRFYPRLYGYGQNWARAGARSDDVLAEFQVEGLVDQISRNEVEVAVVMVGANDVDEVYDSIYDGVWSDLEKNAFVDGFAERMEVIVSAIDNANPELVIVGTVPDLGDTPSYRFGDRMNPDKRGLVTAVVQQMNDRVRAFANDKGVLVVDLFETLKQATAEQTYRYLGYRIDAWSGNWGQETLFCYDAYHPDSLLQSQVGNEILKMIEDERVRRINLNQQGQVDEQTGEPLPDVLPVYHEKLLSNAEIFGVAGIDPLPEIYFPTAEFTDETENVMLSPWLGLFSVDRYPWINHEQHGWLYAYGYGGLDLTFWDSHLGWMFTTPQDYPRMVQIETGEVFIYELGSIGPRIFTKESTSEVFELGPGGILEEAPVKN